ncbi:hypothetical protein UFOVP68_20 [uncultured Caudovirales phage]|uniref:Uncharacterized protein n=1 Tax=uncultured Caudovirales phage TaxID=2100421 RepID=A0A6J5KUD5_9CAUD|nr:hypothetical protein UFOVP68_20 [uncultured Caudovirales phage]
MEYNTIVNIVLFFMGVALAALGWFSRQIWDAVKVLREDLHKIEIDLPKNYTAKDEFNTAMEKIDKGLQRIYDKLDGKADK